MMNNSSFRHSKPQLAADILSRTFKRLHITKKIKQYQSFQYWPDVVGEDISRIAKPERILNKNILVVRVIDAAWVQELSFRKNEYLTKLNNLNENVYFEDIRFICGNPQQFSER